MYGHMMASIIEVENITHRLGQLTIYKNRYSAGPEGKALLVCWRFILSDWKRSA